MDFPRFLKVLRPCGITPIYSEACLDSWSCFRTVHFYLCDSSSINPFMPYEFSHPYQLDQFFFVLRVAGLYFSIWFLCKQTVETLIRRRILWVLWQTVKTQVKCRNGAFHHDLHSSLRIFRNKNVLKFWNFDLWPCKVRFHTIWYQHTWENPSEWKDKCLLMLLTSKCSRDLQQMHLSFHANVMI